MRKMKKIMALVLAVVMCMAMGVTAFAAPTTGHNTITINNAVTNHTYTAYQILVGDYADGKLSNVEWGADITDAGKNALYSKYGLTGDNQTAAKVAEAIADSSITGAATPADSKAIEFANTVGTNVTGGKQGTLSGTTCTIGDLGDGYYMIVDTWTGDASATEGEDYTLARYMVQLVKSVVIDNKADKPTVDKDIVTGTDTTADQNTAQIGDTVNYKLTSKVPEYNGYKEYYMDFTDTLSKGLTFVATPDNTDVEKGVIVKINGVQLAPSAYDVTVGAYSTTSGTSIGIHLYDFVSRKYVVGSTIEITYSATVNDAAVIGNEGNPNTATLTYSNDPLNSGDGTPDNPDDDIVTGTTPPSEVNTFVTDIKLTKVIAGSSTPLAGAVFNVKGSTINKVLVTGQNFVEDANGTYYLLKDNTYTTKAPTTATASQYASTTTKYKLESYATTSVQETADVDFQVVSGADGIIQITGLKEGTYTFTEIQAPDGYNLLDSPIVVTITSNVSDEDATFAWSATSEDTGITDDGDGTFSFNVENNAGAQLPSTGGIGTTVFYMVGAILVIGAGVLMISRRRMGIQ